MILRICFSLCCAALRVLNVPKFRLLPVLRLICSETNRYFPFASLTIMNFIPKDQSNYRTIEVQKYVVERILLEMLP